MKIVVTFPVWLNIIVESLIWWTPLICAILFIYNFYQYVAGSIRMYRRRNLILPKLDPLFKSQIGYMFAVPHLSSTVLRIVVYTGFVCNSFSFKAYFPHLVGKVDFEELLGKEIYEYLHTENQRMMIGALWIVLFCFTELVVGFLKQGYTVLAP